MLVALVQEPRPFEPGAQDDTFRDILDVAGVAIPLALAVLIIAVGWPSVKRWLRHYVRRRRRRRHHRDVHPGAPTTP